MGPRTDERKQLEELSGKLRLATLAAFENGSALARSLDESRTDVERLLMLNAIDAIDYRRAIVRAQMMLEAWHGLAAGAAFRSR